jgi:hypothetical protein
VTGSSNIGGGSDVTLETSLSGIGTLENNTVYHLATYEG